MARDEFDVKYDMGTYLLVAKSIDKYGLGLDASVKDIPEQAFEDIDGMSRYQVFDRILKYEGIYGYTDKIIEWIEDIYNVELK